MLPPPRAAHNAPRGNLPYHAGMKRRHTLIVVLAVTAGLAVYLYTQRPPWLDRVERQLEEYQLQRLAQARAEGGDTLRPFVSDGCSGGLSQGWDYLASVFESFAEQFGPRPPWEACCTEHDRAYWQGVAEDGYAARKRADQVLRACVVQTGKDLSEELSGKWSVTPRQIEQAFRVAGDLMYQAVRVGGGPCTPFAWRWGYGWPPCHLGATR